MKKTTSSLLSGALALCATALATSSLRAQALPETDQFVIQPDTLTDADYRNAPVLTGSQRDALVAKLQAKREKFAEGAQTGAESGPDASSEEPPVPETAIGGGANSEVPGTLRIGRNAKNLNAENAANSTLAEPAAINNRAQVLYAGNFSHIERSLNHGVSYTALAFPAGPADAPSVCCDNDMAQDDLTKIGFVSTLYVNAALTNGVVRIFVRPAANLATSSCSYTIDPAGTANNILPDYPHISVSRNFLYLAINALPTTGTGFARMYRFNLAQMRSCVSATTQTFTLSHSVVGQRVWVPAGGAENQFFMDWVQHDSSTVMRIFHWTDAAAAPTQTTRTLAASNFVNPDCRGGTGNFDFIERSTAFSIAGFRTRSVIARGFNQPTGYLRAFWHSAPTGVATQAHIRSAAFSLAGSPPGFALLSQPHIYNNTFCFGYPAVTSNLLGDTGITLAFGGRAGGGGAAVQAAVGIDDNFTTGFAVNLVLTASGVANRSDGRFGDYYTIHRYQTCNRWFGAANFAWDSAPVDAANDVNARWVEFGREAYLACYNAAQ